MSGQHQQKTIKKIRKFARAPDPGRQRDADRLLASLPADARQELLLELVIDDEHVARELAADLLSELVQSTPSLAERLTALLWQLKEALDDAETPLRQAKLSGGIQAVLIPLRALSAKHGEVTAIMPLMLELASHPIDDLRYAALTLLESHSFTGDPGYTDLLVNTLHDSDSEVRIIAAQGLSRLGVDNQDALEALQAALARSRGLEHVHLLLACAQLQLPGLTNELIDAARRGAHRFASLLALGDYGNPEAIPFLLGEARSWFGERLGRVAAARSAAALGSTEGLSLLWDKFLPSRRPEVRGFALQCLTELHPERAREALVASALDHDDAAAPVAVEQLGLHFAGRDDIARVLEQALDDPRGDVVEAAREALEAWESA